MIRSFCRTICWAVAALFCGLGSRPLSAAPVVLRVRPLRNAGGTIAPELPARLTRALARFLHDHTDPTLRVETGQNTDTGGAREPMTCYALEGDLSYAAGATEESGRYLLVARLLRDGRPSALIGQWAGSAASLRYLTANLRNDPRVHTLGLIGEIGSRVLLAVAADAACPERRWQTLASHLSPLRTPRGSVVQAEAPYAPRTEIVGGDTIRVRLQGETTVGCYLLTFGANGIGEAQALNMTLRETPLNASADSQAVHLPEGTQEAWVICRISVPERSASDARVRSRHTRFCTSLGEEDEAPVQVLNGVGRSASTQNETFTALMAEMSQDSQAWRVMRLRVITARK